MSNCHIARGATGARGHPTMFRIAKNYTALEPNCWAPRSTPRRLHHLVRAGQLP